MPATTAPSGYSRTPIMLHWLVFALIAQQYIFKDAMSATSARITEGAAAGFDPLVPAILARITHGGLYALMILMPLSGAVAWSGGGGAVARGHNMLMIALLALVALHVLGALWYRAGLCDGTLARMRRARG